MGGKGVDMEGGRSHAPSLHQVPSLNKGDTSGAETMMSTRGSAELSPP